VVFSLVRMVCQSICYSTGYLILSREYLYLYLRLLHL